MNSNNDLMQNTPPGSVGCIEVKDVDAYPETMGNWDLEMRQLSSGEFLVHIEYVQVAGILLYREYFSHKAITTGVTPPGSFLFASSRSGNPDIDWCGKNVGFTRLAFSRPEDEIEAITPDENQHVIVEIPEDLLIQMSPDGNELLLQKQGRHITTDIGHGEMLIRSIDQIISKYLVHSALLNDTHECSAIELHVLNCLTELMLQQSEDTPAIDRSGRSAIIQRAIEYVHSESRPIATHELAVAIEVTPRTLQRAFKQKLNISPLKYLRLCRLNAARKALRAADESYATVSSIAIDWGFVEFGRFAADYRQLFGELPSTTLACNDPRSAKDLYSIIPH